MAGGTDPNGCDCTDSDDTGSASRPPVAISVVAGGTDPNESGCTGSDGANDGVIDRTLE